MKLLIISHTAHYYQNSSVVGWGPTVREIDHLAALFERVVHVAPLHPSPVPASALPYTAGNVRLVSVPPSGGAGIRAKLDILRHFPRYARTIQGELQDADAVHVRCPANISLLALLLLALRQHPRLRWIKYAGNWQPYEGEAWSYKLQRWWLTRNFARAQVTVNGDWSEQPNHIHPFLNPSLTANELDEAECHVSVKGLSKPVSLLFVGRVEWEKGAGRAIDVVKLLGKVGIRAHLKLVGDGPERQEIEAHASAIGVGEQVTFYGWVARTELAPFYEQAHFFILPSQCSEGWPKVLCEAMAYGVVPLASDVSSIPQYLTAFKSGRTFPPTDVSAFADAVISYLADPRQWKIESENARCVARYFSYGAYQEAVRRLFNLAENITESADHPAAPLWPGASVR
ncbi:MAG: glycosyltransferase family 4 protein [Anaerolineales bacterium]|nr:glycosyltransferase family 4 protein [Anaerolineales bacterium]